MDIDLDLMYSDLEKLSALYNDLASMRFELDHPEMILAIDIAFSVFVGIMLFVLPALWIWLSSEDECDRRFYLEIGLLAVACIAAAVVICDVMYWYDVLSMERNIAGVEAQIDAIEKRWGLNDAMIEMLGLT